MNKIEKHNSNTPSYHTYIEKRPLTQQISDLALSTFKYFEHMFITFLHWITWNDRWTQTVWRKESSGLVVLVHGLSKHPCDWYRQVEILEKHLDIDILAPKVFARGFCTLQQASDSIEKSILTYTKTHPEKPVAILGTSNGGRIAANLEVRLRKSAPQTPVFVSSAAGVLLGTKALDYSPVSIDSFSFFPLNEFIYMGPTAIKLVEDIKAPLPPRCADRMYELYATSEDMTVFPIGSSLPKLNRNETIKVIHGESHGSIVPRIAQEQIQNVLKWFALHTNSSRTTSAA